MEMRKSMIFIAAIATQCLVAGTGYAEKVVVKITEEQVRTTCGKLIVNAGGRFGCKKNCYGGKTCGFSCDKNGKDCKGTVVEMSNPSSGSPSRPGHQLLQGGILDSGSPAFGTSGPTQTGHPAAPSAPPPVRLQ